MSKEQEGNIRRILLAVDSSSESTGALETAVDLAGSLGADLQALFVEDIDLIHLAALPFAKELGCYSCCIRPVSVAELERQLRGQAEQMRRALAAAAARVGLQWNFRVTRGSVAAEILKAGAEADLVIVGKRGWNLSRRLGSTVQVIISRGTGMTLVLQSGARLALPVVAIYNESKNATKVLKTAGTLARIKEGALLVLVVAPDEKRASELTERASAFLKGVEPEGAVRTMIDPSVSRLAQAVRSMGPVVLPCDGVVRGEEDLCELVNVADNPMLLVR